MPVSLDSCRGRVRPHVIAMSTRALFFALSWLVGLAALVRGQANEQTFYNKSLFGQTTATRATVDQVDQIYFSQPVDFRRNAGPTTGWRVVLQDQDPRTAESIRLSYHGLEFQSIRPRSNAVASVQFTAFGTGGAGARAVIYTFATPSPINLPQFHALGLRMPRPRSWPSDAMTINFQRGDRTKVSTARRSDWTYKLDALGSVVPEWRTGSSFRFGGLYRVPVLQAFNSSNAYTGSSTRDDLFGPEAQVFESSATRSDALGFRADGGARFQTRDSRLGLASVFVAVDYRTLPLPVAPFGTLLIDDPTLTFVSYIVLDNAGRGRGVAGIVPPQLRLRVAWQALFLSIDTNVFTLRDLELSNAVRTTIR